MNRPLGKLRFLVFGGMALAATICMFPAPSHADEFTIEGTTYDITTVNDSFEAIEIQLESQPWWDNSSLAAAFESAVGAALGTPNSVTQCDSLPPAPCDGPLFAYSSVPLDETGIDQFDAAFYDATDQSLDTLGELGEQTLYTFAEASLVATPEPGTLSLLFSGLLFVGLLVRVNRHRENRLATDS
jgi:hypothetical protein